MKKILSGSTLIVVGLVIGYFSQGLISKQLEGANAQEKNEKTVSYWQAPMDPSFRSDKPGKSPMGMDLVPIYEEQGSEDGVVKISPVVQNNIGVRIATVKKGSFERKIKTVGYVQLDEEKIVQLHARVDGWVEKLYVKVSGDEVKKGQKLLALYSPTLVNAQEEYLTALKSNNNYLMRASKDRLFSLGITKGQVKKLEKKRKIRQTIDFYATQGGFISNLKIREGMYVKPTTNILTIARLDTVWVIAEVFERQSGFVSKGQRVRMTTESYAGKQWLGVVDYVYPVLDKKTRTLRLRIRFDNKDKKLKPNMFSQLIIESGYKADSIFVKREAIIRTGTMQRVVKALGEGKFLSVAVKTGEESDGNVEILKGLKEGDQIVTSAQFLIDSESSLNASFERMEEPEMSTMKARDTKQAKMNIDNMNTKHAWVKGMVKNIMAGHNMLTIEHEAIKKWDWPSMLMDFQVGKKVDLTKLSKTMPYEFLLQKNDDGSIEITDIKMGAM